MQLGFLGALGGAAQAGSAAMEQQAKSLAEQKRLQAIEQFKIAAEGRANEEWERRDSITADRQDTQYRERRGHKNEDFEARARLQEELALDRAREMNSVNSYGEIEQHPELGHGQFGPDNQWHSRAPAGAKGSAGSGGGIGGMDSTERRRVLDAVEKRIGNAFTQHTGAEFIGDPDNRALRTAASEVATEVADALYSNGIHFVPDALGSFLANESLRGTVPGLRPSEAMQMAQEELGKGGLFGRGAPSPEQVQARAFEIEQEAKAQLYQIALQRVGGGDRGFLAGEDDPAGNPASPAPEAGDADPAQPVVEPSAEVAGFLAAPQETPAAPRAGAGETLMPGLGDGGPTPEQAQAAIEQFREVTDEQSPGTERGLAWRDKIANDHGVQFITRGIQYGNRNAVEEFGRVVPAIPGKERVAEFAAEARDTVAALFGGAPPAASAQLGPFTKALESGEKPKQADVERAARWALENRGSLSREAKEVIGFWIREYQKEAAR